MPFESVPRIGVKIMENTTLQICTKLDIKPGQLSTFIDKLQSFTATVEATEPLTSTYAWYISDEGNCCYIVERFPNSDAFMEHLNDLSEEMVLLLEMAPIFEVLVFGSPSDDATEGLRAYGAKFFPLTAGFIR
jgi:quinol monooxygenase YgiN